MRYTHRDISRPFEVPFGSWLIPTIGSLLCVLLMKGITEATGYRFLVWTAIGQIIYFSYGFWHSKRRKLMKCDSVASNIDLVLTVTNTMEQNTNNESESISTSENAESSA
ncbi:unnamed protein product [Rotaria sp. Silwood1]|nr:unnamed protein product [Rotaria sp. Silwood1]